MSPSVIEATADGSTAGTSGTGAPCGVPTVPGGVSTSAAGDGSIAGSVTTGTGPRRCPRLVAVVEVDDVIIVILVVHVVVRHDARDARTDHRDAGARRDLDLDDVAIFVLGHDRAEEA
jgi:hypothetical protein